MAPQNTYRSKTLHTDCSPSILEAVEPLSTLLPVSELKSESLVPKSFAKL